jgi:SAM-dependent methyltransferase
MSQDVRSYYDSHADMEWGRLDGALCKIEFASTLHLIDKYFPETGRVCDIGGGPGRYTVELARKGYHVTLFDLSEAEIGLARARLAELGIQAEALLTGDARDLGRFNTGSFDAALLMGPMYHVIDSGQRLGILRELGRILKPNSIAIVAYLNAWGLIKTGVVDFPHWYNNIETLRSMLEEHTFTGQALTGFTECYWATPKAALLEIKEAGLEVVSYAGAESFAGGQGPLIEQLKRENPTAYENLVQVAAETCELPQYRDATDHLHIVVRKP